MFLIVAGIVADTQTVGNRTRGGHWGMTVYRGSEATAEPAREIELKSRYLKSVGTRQYETGRYRKTI